jgi:hypothetical protein
MGDAGFPIAIAVHPPAAPLEDLVRPTSEYSQERARIIGIPMDVEAGAPAWSSAGDMVAYVVAEDFDERACLTSRSSDPTLGDYYPLGCLVVSDVACEHLAFMGQLREDVRRVLGSLKSIAMSVEMYLADNNDTFPVSEDTDQFRQVIGEYVRDELAFLCPGSEDDIAIEYLVEPGVRLVEVENPTEMPVARATCFDDYEIVAYADGHVEVFEK